MSVPRLPARSVAEPTTIRPAAGVSWSTSTGAVTLAGSTPEPESSSRAVKVTVTSVLFQPSAFGAGLLTWVTDGAIWSPSRVTEVTGSTLPARSTA